MLTFIAKRIVSGALLLVVICALTYTLLFFSGQDIARNLAGDQATEAQVAQRAQELGLDRPLLERLVSWSTGALSGDLGTSWFTAQPVAATVASRLPVTLVLVIVSIGLVAVVAAAIGVAAAVRGGWVDRLVQVGSVAGDIVPNFVLALVLVILFAISWEIFPAVSTITPGAPPNVWVASLTLPVIAIVISAVTGSTQQFRSAILLQLEKEYVRTLRSRGIGEGEILFAHVLKNAAPAGLTVLSLQFVGMLGGAVIVERIFSIPGIGSTAIAATTQGDIPVVMGVVIATVTIVVVVNLLVDIANGWLNPKVRVS
ncbi:ABC transporter permease [Microbacterium karelineae]|uniref:ABC transporter permease n=1 Tax=Microbacterium karelineae TaxID=2654283 RepID=UPI0012E99832|nr:ABC transporter permease [Microbacterium karelineae]